jgi:hypothetical protein
MLKQQRTYLSNYFACAASRPGSREPAPSQVKSSPPAPMLLASPCHHTVYGGPDIPVLGVLELVLDTPGARRARLGCTAAPTAQ